MKHIVAFYSPYAGKLLNVSDADAAAAVTDGWGNDVTGDPYPWDSTGVNAMKPAALLPNSYKLFVSTNQGTLSAAIPVISIAKTNPALVTVSAADIAKVNNGDQIVFSGTANPSLDGKVFTVASKNTGAGTFTIAIDLSALATAITQGSFQRLG